MTYGGALCHGGTGFYQSGREHLPGSRSEHSPPGGYFFWLARQAA